MRCQHTYIGLGKTWQFPNREFSLPAVSTQMGPVPVSGIKLHRTSVACTVSALAWRNLVRTGQISILGELWRRTRSSYIGTRLVSGKFAQCSNIKSWLTSQNTALGEIRRRDVSVYLRWTWRIQAASMRRIQATCGVKSERTTASIQYQLTSDQVSNI